MLANIVDWVKSLTMYSVTAWEYGGRHYCWTLSEALEWTKQYPADTTVYIRRFDIAIARRG